MPINFTIDNALGVVFVTMSQSVTEKDLRDYQDQLRADPKFVCSFDSLIDLNAVGKFDVSADGNQRLAYSNPYCAGSRRAYVAGHDAMYGMSRMYTMQVDEEDQEARVFRKIAEARDWLGLSAE